jgi:hypothetical protein
MSCHKSQMYDHGIFVQQEIVIVMIDNKLGRRFPRPVYFFVVMFACFVRWLYLSLLERYITLVTCLQRDLPEPITTFHLYQPCIDLAVRNGVDKRAYSRITLCPVLPYTALYCTALHSTVLYCTTLYCAIRLHSHPQSHLYCRRLQSQP